MDSDARTFTANTARPMPLLIHKLMIVFRVLQRLLDETYEGYSQREKKWHFAVQICSDWVLDHSC